MPRARVRARPRRPKLLIAFMCWRIFREALDQVFTTHHHALHAVNEAVCQQPIPLPDGTVAVPVPPPATPPLVQQQAAQRAAQRHRRHSQDLAFHRQACPCAGDRRLQAGWRSLLFTPSSGTPPPPPSPARMHTPRWQPASSTVSGLYPGALERRYPPHRLQLFRELQLRGYTGSYRRVTAYVSRIRQADG